MVNMGNMEEYWETETTQNQDAENQITKVPATGPTSLNRQRRKRKRLPGVMKSLVEELAEEAEFAAARGDHYILDNQTSGNHGDHSAPV